jgi:hypothetical protein
MWRAVVIALAACGSSSQHVDAHTDPATCKANLEATLDRMCAQPSDCVLVDSADCCGVIKLGIRAGTQSTFPANEATYVACLACGARGCQHPDEAEDGTVPQAGQAIVATCVMGACKSIVQ